MRVLFNTAIYGWKMSGLLGKGGAWFVGFSRQLAKEEARWEEHIRMERIYAEMRANDPVAYMNRMAGYASGQKASAAKVTEGGANHG